MTNYGNFALPLSIRRVKENKKTKEAFERIDALIKKYLNEDYSEETIIDAINGYDKYDEIKELVDAGEVFIHIVEEEFNVSPEPIYIPEDAEGTDKSGKIIWTIPIILEEKTEEASTGELISWSTFS